MTSKVSLPVKEYDGDKWAEISSLAPSNTFYVVGETVNFLKENFSFIGGHRVRKYGFKKNVHFKVPDGVTLDISQVQPATPPRRQPPQRR